MSADPTVVLWAIQELARYWETDYDWRKAEARLNALTQFTTEIDGVEIPQTARAAHASNRRLRVPHPGTSRWADGEFW